MALGRSRYTEKQKAEFRAQFIRRQRYQFACLVPLVGALALVVLALRLIPKLGGSGVITIALGAIALVLAGAGCSWLVWRCPACRRYLGRTLSPGLCPYCGVALASR